MRKIIPLLFFLLSILGKPTDLISWRVEGLASLRPAYGQTSLNPLLDLSKADVFQAEQWVRNVRAFWGTGDYPTAEYYCRLIVAVYPETSYAREAEKFLEKMANPKANRRREYIRKNPGIFPY